MGLFELSFVEFGDWEGKRWVMVGVIDSVGLGWVYFMWDLLKWVGLNVVGWGDVGLRLILLSWVGLFWVWLAEANFIEYSCLWFTGFELKLRWFERGWMGQNLVRVGFIRFTWVGLNMVEWSEVKLGWVLFHSVGFTLLNWAELKVIGQAKVRLGWVLLDSIALVYWPLVSWIGMGLLYRVRLIWMWLSGVELDLGVLY